MLNEIKSILIDFEIKPITETDFTEAMEIYTSNQDYFIMTEGAETTFDKSINDIRAVPPGFDPQNKIYAGIWENGKIIGVIDLLTGYPEPRRVWIGFLLIRGDLRGKGYGRKIIEGVLNAVKIKGYEAAELGVKENNEPGFKFWSRLGFEKSRESQNVIIMEKFIK